LINLKIYARAKTESTKKHIESLFNEVEYISTDDVQEKEREIIVYEILEDCTRETLCKALSTSNFLLFISDVYHDSLLLELSGNHHFSFCLKSDPINEITIRFNTLVKYKELTIELENKTEEMESTIFELAFASTNVLEQNEFLEQMARKDGLTMLFNHSYFKDKLKDEMVRSERYNNKLTIALLDLDFFKKVNDQYGHVKGDEVLKAFANIIKETVRSTDIAARYGGEEFAVLFTETHIEDAVTVVDRIREKLANTVFNSDTKCFKVTFSAGVTQYSSKYSNAESMVDVADKALYQSKENGRNRTTILTAEDI